MTERRIGIIMHGVTGRMGTNQHLVRSILAIRDEGGIELSDGTRILPEPILVGRDPKKLEHLVDTYGLARWTLDLEAALAETGAEIFFDAASTKLRAGLILRAIAAGKHVYCEKPVAENLEDALRVWRAARAAGIRHGVVQDKLWLPGLQKLKMLIDAGFFGRILSVKGDFGYWVFEGHLQPAQRPSWNYRKEQGGGIILDMLCHWRYVLDNLFGEVQAVSCFGATHIPERIDEHGRRYRADADDAAYAIFQLADGIVAQFNSSWCTRVRKDDLLTIQVDGTHGSAVAGLTRCLSQSNVNTPRPIWNPDAGLTPDFSADWQEVPDTQAYDNAFKAQWELFLRHVCGDLETFPWDLHAAAKGVQLAGLGYRSWQERRWLDVPPLEA
jgi:predicted dehydrogenase